MDKKEVLKKNINNSIWWRPVLEDNVYAAMTEWEQLCTEPLKNQLSENNKMILHLQQQLLATLPLKKQLEESIYLYNHQVQNIIRLQSQLEEKDREIERLKGERTDLIKQLREFISMHETGLLPNRFTYEDAKMTLNGMGE